jgi:hypothetical protein
VANASNEGFHDREVVPMLPLAHQAPAGRFWCTLRETAQVRRKLRQAAQFREISVGLDPKLEYSSLRLRRIVPSPKKVAAFFWRGTHFNDG